MYYAGDSSLSDAAHLVGAVAYADYISAEG